MSLSTYCLEYGRHVARLHHRHRHLVYAPMSNTASHDNHEKSIHGFPLISIYGCSWGSAQSSAINKRSCPFFKYAFIMMSPYKGFLGYRMDKKLTGCTIFGGKLMGYGISATCKTRYGVRKSLDFVTGILAKN